VDLGANGGSKVSREVARDLTRDLLVRLGEGEV
jgi:hypothetical protein